MTDLKDENPLHLSWHDLAWIPHLNTTNVLDYFSERSNPFYDRTCNNEVIKMQKTSLDQLKNMNGLEYILLHVQEPILFIIRKQNRHSPTQVTPLADYYIIAGYVYQAPDLNSLISFRLTSSIHHLVSAFDEAQSYMRYHPTKGYSWEFNKDGDSKDKDLIVDKQKEEPSSAFQRARVDSLLGEICKKFFPKNIDNTTNNNKSNEQQKQQNGDINNQQLQTNCLEKQDKTTMNTTTNQLNNNQNSNFNRTGTNQPIDKKQRIN